MLRLLVPEKQMKFIDRSMKRKLYITAILGLISFNIFSQTYTMSNSTTGAASYATTCSGTFVDDGGAGNYSNGVDASYTFYPTAAGQYTRLTFNSFNTQVTADYLAIYDGPAGPLLGTYSGTPGVFTVTASSSNSSRGLTCRFHANGTTVSSGWSATISCTATPAAPPAFTVSPRDCEQGGGTTVCSNSNLTANSSGTGAVNDLPNPMNGCLSGENQSSWYYFSPSSSGTVGFTIAPANGTDDYDFAVWGPFTNVECPLNVALQPLRCSYSGLGGNTGCGNGAVDLSEGAGGDKWVSTFNVVAGEIYVMVIDNYLATSNPFTLTWSLSGGASLNCSVLPVEFLTFTGEAVNDYHELIWQTASELNNDHFTVERATDGMPFEAIGEVAGAGTSTQLNSYVFDDKDPKEGWNYYRIRQTDLNGQSTVSNIIALQFHTQKEFVESVHPVPATDEVFFDFVSPGESEIVYQLTDCTGRIVSEQKVKMKAGNNSVKIDLSDNETGVYFLRVINQQTNYVFVTKLVK
jgi:hypothetical protein